MKNDLGLIFFAFESLNIRLFKYVYPKKIVCQQWCLFCPYIKVIQNVVFAILFQNEKVDRHDGQQRM